MAEKPEQLDVWIAEFVETESAPARVDEWVRRTSETILDETPEVAEDATLAQLVRDSVRAHWTAFLGGLTGPVTEIRLVQPAADLAGVLAHRRLHLATLFKLYRIAQQATWRHVIDAVRRADTQDMDDTEVLVHVWSRASSWIDASVTASVDIYQRERDRIRQGAAAARLEWVRKALDGDVPDLREFSAHLDGYPVSECNTALVLQAPDDDGFAQLEQAAKELAREIGSRHPLLVAPGGRELWAWAATHAVPDLSGLAGAQDDLRDAGIIATVGTPVAGIDGFVVSHREAQTARRIALQSATPAPLTLFTDVELVALMSQSGDAATRFVRRTLGPLAEPTETARRLRETVLALLDSGSVEQAARRLVVHKNTVRYRVGQAEEALGHSVAECAVELATALRYHAAFSEE